MFRIVATLLAGLLLCAQTPMLPGFPPGTFQSRAALDAGGAAVTPVAVNTAPGTASNSTGGTTTYTGMTIASGGAHVNIGAVFFLMFDTSTPPTITSITWGAQTPSLIISSPATGGNSGTAMIYCLANPTTGNQTLTVNYTGAPLGVYLSAMAFDNVAQASNAAMCPNSNAATANSGSPSVAFTAGANDYGVALTNVPSGNTVTAHSDTQLFFSNIGNNNNAQAEYGAGAGGTKTMTNTLSATGLWSMAGASVAVGP